MPAEPSMPDAEAAHLAEAYREARVILEFGSGGSTRMASQMPGKYILSVENDRDWARNLRKEIAAMRPVSPVTVYHVDLGPTAAWGRLIDDSRWRDHHRYPNAIWDEPFFRHPDVILIDGRFRVACLMAAMLRIERPVRVLFDDYVDRPSYRRVEALLKPTLLIGRMAEFRLVPGMARPADMGFIIGRFFEVTVRSAKSKAATSYEITRKDEAEMDRFAKMKRERAADEP